MSSRFIKILVIFIATLTLSALEIFAFKNVGHYRIIASRVWLVWSSLYVIICIKYTFKTLFHDIRTKTVLGIASLVAVTTLVVFDLETFPLNISGEATQQVHAGLEHWKESDFGYAGTSFLGNPNKQFLLNSLPSFLTGRSIKSYRLGYILPFLLGIFLFYSGLRLHYSKYNGISTISGLMSLAVIAFPVVPVLLRTFEQITNPLSFTLQAIGMFLITRREQNIINTLALGWILVMLSNAYVPALAVWGLFSATIAILALKKFVEKDFYKSVLWVSCFILSFLFGILSYTHRTDTKLPDYKNLNGQEVVKKVTQSLEYFFIKNTDMYDQQLPLIGQVVYLPVVAYVLGSLTLSWGLTHFVLVAWILSVIIISGISPGYARPPISFGIHRSIIVIPFILWGIVDLLQTYRIVFHQRMKIIIFSLILLFNIHVIHVIYARSASIFDIRSLFLRETISTARQYSINPEKEVQLGIYDSLKTQFLYDHLHYFFPKFIVFQSNQPCLTGFKPDVNMILYIEGSECSEELKLLNLNVIADTFDFEFLNTHYSFQSIVYRAN